MLNEQKTTRRRFVLLPCFLTVLSWWPIHLQAAEIVAPPTQEVDDAIARAIKFLYSQQHDGNWETAPRPPQMDPPTGAGNPNGGNWGGTTALVTYALLSSGEDPQSPAIQQAVHFLAGVRFTGIYSVGLRCQVWNHVERTPAVRAAAVRDHEILLRSLKSLGPAVGMYWYAGAPPTYYDHSISQYGVLGLWACAEMSLETPLRAWTEIDRAWRSHQYDDGSWSYVFKAPGPEQAKPTMAMTTAGVATLFLTSEFSRPTEGISCRPPPPDENIEKGLQWIGDHFTSTYVPATYLLGEELQYYALFGMERCGVASGRKYFGHTDWYASGATYLLGKQFPAGNWAGRFGPVCDTAFSMLFLAHGRAPVVINKLQYSLAGSTQTALPHWNQRSLDALHLVQWMSRVLEKKLNWQIVNLSVPAADLHEAPILMITGDQALNLSPQDVDTLRLFVQQGGLILGNSDCGNELFAKSFQKLGAVLFPALQFRELEQNHPILTNEQFPAAKWRTKPQVLAMSNGVRELMLLPQDDLSRAFQAANDAIHPDLYQLADDIVLYAVDKTGFREKGDSFIVISDPAVAATKSVKLARLRYPGNWDPEPGGWRRLASVLHNTAKLDLSAEPVKLGDGALRNYRLAHLTGTAKFELSDAGRSEIKTFVAAGGTLIVDAAGGSTEFAASAEIELRKIFGDAATAALSSPLLGDHPVYTLPGFSIDSVKYRRFGRARVEGASNAPRLCGIEQNRHTVCFFSREDLSAGLVGEPIDGVVGYVPDSATSIVRNIVISSIAGKR